jgi:hypothetical protein
MPRRGAAGKKKAVEILPPHVAPFQLLQTRVLLRIARRAAPGWRASVGRWRRVPRRMSPDARPSPVASGSSAGPPSVRRGEGDVVVKAL